MNHAESYLPLRAALSGDPKKPGKLEPIYRGRSLGVTQTGTIPEKEILVNRHVYDVQIVCRFVSGRSIVQSMVFASGTQGFRPVLRTNPPPGLTRQ